MGYSAERVAAFCLEKGIECDNAADFDILCERLLAFNAHTNVTAIKTESGVCVLHFLDSLYALAYDLIPRGASVIDIGCGAGFPGLPLAMVRKDIHVSFVDSTAKKLKFTSEISDLFGLGADVFPARAEELLAGGHREKYDIAVSRAVASLPVLCELCLPYVKVGGAFIAYKSKKECDTTNPMSELSLAKKAIPALGGKVEVIHDANLTEDDGRIDEHALIVIRKVKATNPIYPRRYAAIVKKPL